MASNSAPGTAADGGEDLAVVQREVVVVHDPGVSPGKGEAG